MIDPYDTDSDGDDPEVTISEWTWGKAPVSCPWVKEIENTYDFDVKKADKIFDLLPEKKQLRLPAYHMIPSAEELKGRNIASFTMLPIITLMSAESFVFTIKRPLNKE